jgi:hypothetical protein
MKTKLITFFDIKGIAHFEFIPQSHRVNKTYYMEILKRLREDVRRKKPELWPNVCILHHDNAVAHKTLSVKQCLAQKIDYRNGTSDLAASDFWLFPKIDSALKDEDFRTLKTSKKKKKCDDGTESYFIAGVPKMFLTVAASLGKVHSCSRRIL